MGVVDLRVVIAALLKLLHALCCPRAQIIEAAEHNRFSRTNFRARGYETALLSIITKRAFERATGIRQRVGPPIDYTERARNDTVPATVANIVLHEN